MALFLGLFGPYSTILVVLRTENYAQLIQFIANMATNFGKKDILKLFEEQNLDNYDELMKNCLKSESVECVKILKKMAKNHVFSEEVVQAARNTGNLEVLEMFGILDIVIEEEMNKLYRRVTRKETKDIRGKNEALLLFINLFSFI